MNASTSVPGSVHSVGKAMVLLDKMLEKRSPLTLKELSEVTGYPKSTVHAALQTLREFRIVEQSGDGRYKLGIHLYELGCAAASSWDISALAHPYLEKLSEETGASSFLSVLDQESVMTFDHSTRTGGLQVVPDKGSRLPLHATCQGKVLLSAQEDETIHRYLERTPLSPFTPHTITEPQRLLEEIQNIREKGYAVEDGEYRIGLRAVAAGIRDRRGKICYALGTLGFFRRVYSPDFQEAVDRTVYYAGLLSEEVAHKMV